MKRIRKPGLELIFRFFSFQFFCIQFKKKLPLVGESFLKISFLKVIGFSRMTTAGLKPVFIGINIFQKDRFKKKEVD